MALIDVPLAAQTLAQTQNPIRQNFLTINNAFAIDHVVFGITGQGKHNKSTYPEQTVSPTTLVNEGAVFTRQGTTTAVTELAYRRENNGTVTEMTESILSTSLPANDANGWTRLPSGILLKWLSSAGGSGSVNFNSGGVLGPNFAAIFNVQLTPSTPGATGTAVVNSITNVAVTVTAAGWYLYAVGR